LYQQQVVLPGLERELQKVEAMNNTRASQESMSTNTNTTGIASTGMMRIGFGITFA